VNKPIKYAIMPDTSRTHRVGSTGKAHIMKKIHPVKAIAALVGIALTADWFVRREESLIHELISALGDA
jgi:hypothetical protein